MSPQASTAGADDFGYVWNVVPMAWMDAVAGGTDAGLAEQQSQTGPIGLPFAFNYYENTYSRLFINSAGYLRFDSGYRYDRPYNMPSPGEPNDVIASMNLWSLYPQPNGTNGRIYYKAGGSAPNRYFVVQWNNIAGGPPDDSYGNDDLYRFQVVLQESGNILFQYASVNIQNGWWCPGSIGIEDSTGRDGFTVYGNCNNPMSNTAIQFARPGPAARMRVIEQFDGSHTAQGVVNDYLVQVTNTGDVGADAFEITAFSPAFGTASLFAADGFTPLGDSNGNSTPDTGALAKGQSRTVVVRTQTSSIAPYEAGGYGIFFKSSLNGAVQKQSAIRQSSPARFAQVFVDGYSTLKLYLAHPAGQKTNVIADVPNASSPAVVEAPNGNFVIAWSQGRCLGSPCNFFVNELYYAIADKYGRVVREAAKLTDLSNVSQYTSDGSPRLVAAPNGQVAVAWMRYSYRSSDDRWQRNAYLAVLDSAGNVSRAGFPITNNGFSNYQDVGTSSMTSRGLGIASTTDNRFAIALSEEARTGPQSGCNDQVCYVVDVFFSLYDTAGNLVRGKTKLTNDVAGWRSAYETPSVTRLKNGNVAVNYADTGWDTPDIFTVILNGAGNVIRSARTVSNNGTMRYEYGPSAVETADGRVVIAYESYWEPNYTVNYSILNSNFDLIESGTQFVLQARSTSQAFVSVTADGDGRAIVSWMDADWSFTNQLFYGLIDLPSSFPSRTGAQIYFTSHSKFPNAATSEVGFGNTTYSSALPATDGVVKVNAGLVGGEPNSTANVPIEIINHGTAPASNLVLTATLGSSALAALGADAGALTYAGDTSGVTPTVSGNTVVWNLPSVSFLQQQRFNLYVNVPDLPYGTQLDVSLSLSVDGAEPTPSDNAAQAKVRVSRQVYVPISVR
jgi:hypothetical protein